MAKDSGMKTNKLSIYLIKQGISDFADIVESDEDPIVIPDVGDFFFDGSHTNAPDWISKFFTGTLGGVNIFTASARGVLIVPVERVGQTIRFVLTFGVGRHLLKSGVTEERFGLRVVLNSVDPGGFRCIEKTALGSVPKHSREQMTRDVHAGEFGIDVEQDLIGTVTGKSRDAALGKIITGRDALHLSVKADVTNVKDLLAHCYDLYLSNAYQADFDWIDHIKDVRDPQLEDELNADLIQKLVANDLGKMWMAVPEVINWSDLKGFLYGNRKNADLHDGPKCIRFSRHVERRRPDDGYSEGPARFNGVRRHRQSSCQMACAPLPIR